MDGGDAGDEGGSFGRIAGLLALYLGLAVVATWPLAASARDHLFGLGTPPLNVWAIAFVLRQVVLDPLHLFQGNQFHPWDQTLAWSEHLIVPALLASPVVALTGNPVLGHNVVALLSMALAGLGMHLLAAELTRDRFASAAAGIFYAFHTWNVNELVRLQILSNQWFPFVLLALLRFFRAPSWRRAAAVALFMALQSLSCMYWALYLPLLAGPAIVLLQWHHRLPWRRLVPLAAAVGVAAGATLAVAIPYVTTSRALGFERARPEALLIGRYADVMPGNWLYETWLGTAGPNQNAAHFPGFVALGLAVMGLARASRFPDRPWVRTALAVLALAGFALSLGPEITNGTWSIPAAPYRLLECCVPGFRNVRYPERLSIFFVLALGPLLAAGLAALRGRTGPVPSVVALALLFVEHLAIPLPLVRLPTGDEVPSVYRWLAKEPGVRVVAEVPASRHRMERVDADALYFSTVHWKRTVQGFSGYFPPTYNVMKWRLFHFPAPESLDFVERFGIDTVVVGPGAALPPSTRGTVVGPFAEGHHVWRPTSVNGEPAFPPPAARADLVELDRRQWDVQASWPSPGVAVDGRVETAWQTGLDRQGKGDFYRITFPGPVMLARVSMTTAEFPMHLRLLGQSADGAWDEIPFDEKRTIDHYVGALLHRPREATFDVDVPPTLVRAIRLRIVETDPFWMPWSIAEIRAYRPGS